MIDFAKAYDPKETEASIYKKWLDSGYFTPENLPGERTKPFTIMMPPPNRTGTLHVGHALGTTIQDIMIRFERMRGKKALWLPGTDHAAIATQTKVEAILYKEEEKTRHDLGREEFLKRVVDFADKSHDTIIEQTKRLGASCDWSREGYTFDEARNQAVNTAFKKMYDAGLIYRGARTVNWDPKLQTTVSDEEVEWKEEKAPFYYLQYGPFVIGTSRPETKFGDKYIVMHPDDERYAQYKDGQKIECEWINGKVTATVVKDAVIDREFGTGVMTITPWHDAVDFDLAERHQLDKEQIIDLNGKLLPIAGELAGLHIKKARLAVVEKLKTKGLLVKVEENYTHRVATNSRGGGMIEPQILKQWWVDVNKEFTPPHSNLKGIPAGQLTTLKTIMRTVIESGQIKIIPDFLEKTYFHWIDNLRDWCISRQIWFGHRVPVWYRGDTTYCGITAPEGDGWEQDSDTLDTWFSSGLWTFSSLGWPNETNDFKTYHPTDVLETGRDIIFFWVARMILMTGFHLGEIPFHTIYLHGMVRDESRRKMSKSLDNIVNPLELIDKYGTDALRMGLVVGNTPGTDLALAEDKIKGYKHFANKIWNASRFVVMNLDEGQTIDMTEQPELNEEQVAALKTLDEITKEATRLLDEYKFYLAAEQLYHYFWHTFADIVIEQEKENLKDEYARAGAQYVLATCLTRSLKLLHPFMPFVTETVWQSLPKKKDSLLLVEEWPK